MITFIIIALIAIALAEVFLAAAPAVPKTWVETNLDLVECHPLCTCDAYDGPCPYCCHQVRLKADKAIGSNPATDIVSEPSPSHSGE